MIFYKGTPTIETPRLVLRRIELIDTQSIFDHKHSDERVTDNLNQRVHKTVSETQERVVEIVSGYTSQEFCYWGIELKDSGELIGAIDLFDFDNVTENCQVGYSIGYEWWNQGYGTEALSAVLDFGFKDMNVHKISAAHNIDNPASGKIMRKVGMQQEGIIRHMLRNAKNQYKDCVVYGILKEDYLKNTIN